VVKGDYLHECLTDPALTAAARKGPDVFAEKVCGVCRNFDCVRTTPNNPESNPWLERMSTQEDRLLINPQFADLRDPQFAKIRDMDFQAAIMEAINVDLATSKGDWSMPTPEEQAAYLDRMGIDVPPEPQADEPEPEPDEPEAETIEVKIERAKTGRSTCRYCRSKIVIGQPRFGRHAFDPMVGKAVWQWYHVPCAEDEFPEEVAQAQGNVPEPPTPPTPPTPEPPPPPPQEPESTVPQSRVSNPVVGPAAREFMPAVHNTPAPKGGIILGQGPASRNPDPDAAPAPDPWAAPAPSSAQKVEVGGTVRMTGEKPSDTDE